MTEQLPKLVLSDSAETALWSMRDVNRERVEGLLESLRYRKDDPYVRDHTTPLREMPDHYAFKTPEWLIFFQATDTEITVLSIHRPEVLDKFWAGKGVSA